MKTLPNTALFKSVKRIANLKPRTRWFWKKFTSLQNNLRGVNARRETATALMVEKIDGGWLRWDDALALADELIELAIDWRRRTR